MNDSILLLTKQLQKEVKLRIQRQLTDRAECAQPSSVPPNTCWRGDSPTFELSTFPTLVRSRNENSREPDLKLYGRPCIEINGFNFANVSSHGPVDTRAPDTQKHAAGDGIS